MTDHLMFAFSVGCFVGASVMLTIMVIAYWRYER